MRSCLFILLMLTFLVPQSLAQQDPDDPGVQDSVIVDSLIYQPWEEQPHDDSLYVRIWAVTDDSVESYSIPLIFTYGGDGILSPAPEVRYFPPISSWDEYIDTLLLSERRLGLSGRANLDSTWNTPLFTGAQRVRCWQFRLRIEPGSRRPMWVRIDTTYDSQIGSLHFGIRDYGEIDTITPGFRSGIFSLQSWFPSSIDDKIVPDGFSLLQNHPNPFNAQTTIEFTLEHASHVVINIYDVAGRKVAVATDGEYSAGVNRVVFNSKQLSSGPYFYKINADNNSDNGKMILLK